MSNRALEDYMDNLLDSISDIDKSKKTEVDFSPENIFGDSPFGRREDPEDFFGSNPFEEPADILDRQKNRLSADDEFLREFERELESDAYKDYFTDFEAELEEEQRQELEIPVEPEGIGDHVDSLIQGIEENSKEVEAVPAMPNPSAESAEEMLQNMERRTEEKGTVEEKDPLDAINAIMDDLGDLAELGDIEEIGEIPLSATDGGEPDLSGIGDADLMDLLSKEGDLSDLGDILQSSDSDIPLDGTDAIGDFAKNEMSQAEGDEETEGKKGRKRAKKEKKKKDGEAGFFDKLKLMLFGEDDDEDDGRKTVKKAPSAKDKAKELSDENSQILADLEGEDKAEAKKGKKAKKAKKEKKPKEKGDKAPKEKKEKPKKPPKPKKEKKPKEKDNTPPLPKKPVFMILLMAASFVVLVMLGTNLLNYNSDLSFAQEMYNKKNYTEGYQKLQGQEMKEDDIIFYNQIKILATVDSQYQAYLVFEKNGQYARALDSLICAAGRYSLNMEYVVEMVTVDELAEGETPKADLQFMAEYTTLGEKIASALSQYGMTLEEAILMYAQPNQIEYTMALEDKLESLGIE